MKDTRQRSKIQTAQVRRFNEAAQNHEAILEQVRADDHQWFREHPGADERIRTYVLGESPPEEVGNHLKRSGRELLHRSTG